MKVIQFEPGRGRLLQGHSCRVCGDTVDTGCRTCHGVGHLTIEERAAGLVPCDVCGLAVDPRADACSNCG